MSHIVGDICARTRTCSGVSVIERLPFLWPPMPWRFFAFLASAYSQRNIRPKNALWTMELGGSDAGGGCGGSSRGVVMKSKLRAALAAAWTALICMAVLGTIPARADTTYFALS